MDIFKNNGLYILPEGYFFSSWNTDIQKYEGKKLTLAEIETHLHSEVFLNNETRLKHLLEPLLESKIFEVVYKRDFWKEMVNEIKSSPWKVWIGDEDTTKDGDEVEYVEVYSFFEYSEAENKIQQIPDRLYFHGISYPYITQEKADEMHSKIGQVTSYSLSTTSINNYMNTPLRVGKFCLDKFTKDYQVEKVIENAEITLSLGILIHSILWDMSFYGSEQSRTQFVNSLGLEEVLNDLS